jgi:hypothetical protein
VLGTYASFLLIVAASAAVGQAAFVVCGRREISWTAPAVGLALLCPLAWGAVQLPGHGTAALIAVLVAAAVGAAVCWTRLETGEEGVIEGLAVAVIGLIAVSIPFASEHHFGILGTGLNPDMSQHLFAASWIADPQGSAPHLLAQGYPVGPHSLAVGASKLTGGNLAEGFTGVTIALPVLAALAALSALGRLSPPRRIAGAVLVGVTYMVASYLAQGQFKELFEALFVLAFGLALDGLVGRDTDAPRWRLLRAVPLAALAIGALYTYSAPGLAWLAGAAGLWALVVLARSADRRAATRAAIAPVAIGLAAIAIVAVPEAGRIANFEGNANRVATAARAPSGLEAVAEARADPSSKKRHREHFDNSLGNLFNPISPLEGLGIWPTGDFRLDPGAGAAPAAAFYLGGALAALAVGLGCVAAWRRGRLGLLAAVAVAAGIYVGAWAVGTPYTAAKAILMFAAPAALLALSTLLHWDRRSLAIVAVALAYTVGAMGSSLLALANAPVGPSDYSPGLADLREKFARKPTLVVAPRSTFDREHLRDYFAWEARGADPLCVEPAPESATGPVPTGIRFVVTENERQPPYDGLVLRRRDGDFALWRVSGPPRGTVTPGPPGDPTSCSFGAIPRK